MAAITICSDFGSPENKVSHCFHYTFGKWPCLIFQKLICDKGCQAVTLWLKYIGPLTQFVTLDLNSVHPSCVQTAHPFHDYNSAMYLISIKFLPLWFSSWCLECLLGLLWCCGYHSIYPHCWFLPSDSSSTVPSTKKISRFVFPIRSLPHSFFLLKIFFSLLMFLHLTPVLLPGKSHGRRSLVGCGPWGR